MKSKSEKKTLTIEKLTISKFNCIRVPIPEGFNTPKATVSCHSCVSLEVGCGTVSNYC